MSAVSAQAPVVQIQTCAQKRAKRLAREQEKKAKVCSVSPSGTHYARWSTIHRLWRCVDCNQFV